MADAADGATSAPEGQAPAGGAPQAGSQPNPGGQAPAGSAPAAPPAKPADDDPDAGLSEADLRQALKKVRAEAADQRIKLKGHEDKAEADRLAKLSESERLTAERDKAIADLAAKDGEIRNLTARTVILEAATKAGFRNPELAYRLIDVGSLEFGSDGKPKGVDQELRKLLEKEPYLAKGQGSGDFGGGPRGGAGGGVDMNDMIRRATGRA